MEELSEQGSNSPSKIPWDRPEANGTSVSFFSKAEGVDQKTAMSLVKSEFKISTWE